MRKVMLSGAVLAVGLPLWAQDVATTAAVAPPRSTGMLDWTVENIVLVIGVATIIAAFAALYRAMNLMLEAQRLRLLQESGVPITLEDVRPATAPLWQRLYDRWTDAVPVEREDDVMLDHDYDGIHELDNSLPPWWVALFYVTIAFGVVYVGYYHFSDYGLNSREEYEQNMELAQAQVQAYLATQADQVDENNVTVLKEVGDLALGESIYKANCVACHGAVGEGGVGPNLTDAYWLHGADITAIFKSVKYGFPEKGMVAWKSQLRPGDIQRVSSYVLTLVGTNPPNGKEPQGERVDPAEVTSPQDSTATDEDLGMLSSEKRE